jgi:hypothetical protein
MLESISIPAIPPLEVLLPCALAAVATAFALAACFGPMIAIVGEKLSVSEQRGFYAKAGQQMAQMSLFFGVLAAGLLVACVMWIAADEPAIFQFPYSLPLMVTGGAITATLLTLCLYVFLRPQKGPSIAVHALIGFISTVFSIISLFLCTSMIRRLLHTVPDISEKKYWIEQLVQFFAIPAESLFWPLLLEAAPLGFAFAGSFAAVWLIIMRERQDYGRDYYAFALPYCAKWALWATVLAIPAGVYAMLRGQDIMLPELSHLSPLLLDCLSVILPLLACLLWNTIITSEHPMRRKLSVFAACLFLLTGFAGQILMLSEYSTC